MPDTAELGSPADGTGMAASQARFARRLFAGVVFIAVASLLGPLLSYRGDLAETRSLFEGRLMQPLATPIGEVYRYTLEGAAPSTPEPCCRNQPMTGWMPDSPGSAPTRSIFTVSGALPAGLAFHVHNLSFKGLNP
jgi:hypothetical protein